MPAGNMGIVNMRLSGVLDWKTPLEPFQGLVGELAKCELNSSEKNQKLISLYRVIQLAWISSEMGAQYKYIKLPRVSPWWFKYLVTCHVWCTRPRGNWTLSGILTIGPD